MTRNLIRSIGSTCPISLRPLTTSGATRHQDIHQRTGAFGGSINIRSDATSRRPSVRSTARMVRFNTWKNTLRFGTGLLQGNSGWKADCRDHVRRLHRADQQRPARSYYLSGGCLEKTSRFASYCSPGRAKTYQAGTGTGRFVATNRQFNPAGLCRTRRTSPLLRQSDRHYQLGIITGPFYNRTLGKILDVERCPALRRPRIL